MTKAQLRASLVLWRRRHRFRMARAAYHERRGNTALYRKWRALYITAGREIRRRQAQLAKLNKPKPSKRAAAVAKARSYIGVHETYYNGGGIINTWQARLGFGRVPWCGIFCGNMLLAVGKSVPSAIASVAMIEEMAQRRQAPFRGWSTDEKNAHPGDLAVIGAYGQHVEMVERVNADGSLTTIGGNVGNAVRRMHRPRAVVRGIAQVDF